MPVCFQLFKKGSAEPAQFCDVDDEIRIALNQPPDSKNYYLGWYDAIGMTIACGRALGSDDLRAWVAEYTPRLQPILEFLEANYSSDAWREVGKR